MLRRFVNSPFSVFFPNPQAAKESESATQSDVEDEVVSKENNVAEETDPKEARSGSAGRASDNDDEGVEGSRGGSSSEEEHTPEDVDRDKAAADSGGEGDLDKVRVIVIGFRFAHRVCRHASSAWLGVIFVWSDHSSSFNIRIHV